MVNGINGELDELLFFEQLKRLRVISNRRIDFIIYRQDLAIVNALHITKTTDKGNIL